MKIVILLLTCTHENQATTIAKSLLEQKLIACAKQLPISTLFRWHQKIESSQEILLLMETTAIKLPTIEIEVKKIHSYETFVLVAFEALYVSSAAKQWIQEELQ